MGFMNVPNGDVIAFDMKESEINPSVVYLSHDDGEGHGYILGKDFNTYLESFNRFLIISLDVLICRYSPLLRAFPALFISEEPHKSFYYPSCFHSQK